MDDVALETVYNRIVCTCFIKVSGNHLSTP